MTNFTIKNNVKAENVKLLDAMPYQEEDGTWYMQLKYEYEDGSGIHIRYYPKVEFPFFCGKLPPEEFSSDSLGRIELTMGLIADAVAVHRGNFWNPHSGRTMNDVFVVDHLAKPDVHNMTIEEIEKELGYKINIIGKGE